MLTLTLWVINGKLYKSIRVEASSPNYVVFKTHYTRFELWCHNGRFG